MSEGVPDTSHLPFKMGQEVICIEGRVRRELGRDEKGGEGGEELMGVGHVCADSSSIESALCQNIYLQNSYNFL